MIKARLNLSLFLFLFIAAIPSQATQIVCMDRGLSFVDYFAELDNVFYAEVIGVDRALKPGTDTEGRVLVHMDPYSYSGRIVRYRVVEVLKGNVKPEDFLIRVVTIYEGDWEGSIGKTDLLIGEVDEFGYFVYSTPCELNDMSRDQLEKNIRALNK